ncbi:MAG: YidB family protein [Janthinobacterium lividum]
MGLLDSVLGQVLGGGAARTPGDNQGDTGATGTAGGLAGILGSLLANNGALGGLGGLVSKFEQAGLGDKVNSWVGKGENAPVSEGEVGHALGGDVISNLAGKFGMSAATLLPLLATLLPSLIDKLTPHGTAPAQGLGDEQDLMGSLSSLLQKR